MQRWSTTSPNSGCFFGSSKTRPLTSTREASSPADFAASLSAFSSHLSLSKVMDTFTYSPQSSPTCSAGFRSTLPLDISATSYSVEQSLQETISPTMASLGTDRLAPHSAQLVFNLLISPPGRG